jgi:hypothetical protein
VNAKLIALLALAFLALQPLSAAAADVDRCGTITEVSLEDLTSGGFISIDGDKYLVGGVGRAGPITLPTAAQAIVGERVCFKGTIDPGTAGTFEVRTGTFTIQTATLPSTATGGGGYLPLVGLGTAFVIAGSVLLARQRSFRDHLSLRPPPSPRLSESAQSAHRSPRGQ